MRTSTSHEAVPRQRVLAVVVAVLCAATAWQLDERRQDERTLRQANEAGSRGDLDRALALAASLRDGTTAADARYVEAQAHLGRRDLPAARAALEAAIRARPNDWRARRDLALVLLVTGERGLARRQYARALGLNPRMPRLTFFDG